MTCSYGKNISYPIKGIKFDLNPQSTFIQEKNGEPISYQKYY